MKGSQLAVRCERVGYNTGMIAFATRQNETAKWAILPRADARAGEGKSATVFNWSDGGDNITVSSPSTHGLLGFYDQEPSNVASVDQSNQQYSILALTDSSGNVSERYAYTAYGQPTFLNSSGSQISNSAISNRYTYTAREWDSTLGLHHFRARWMSGLTSRFLSRDPVGYVDGFNHYTCYYGLDGTDPSGLFQDPHGPGQTCESYWNKFLADHPGVEKDFPECWRQYTRGCVGITLINLGEDRLLFPSFKHCFSDKPKADAYLKTFKCAKGETPRLFSVHFYWPDLSPTFRKRDDGSVDIDPWTKGGYKAKTKGSIKYDFGFCQEDGKIVHADHCHNPSGRIYPFYKIQEPMTVYISSLSEWQRSYDDFNQEVWCVTCSRPFVKGR